MPEDYLNNPQYQDLLGMLGLTPEKLQEFGATQYNNTPAGTASNTGQIGLQGLAQNLFTVNPQTGRLLIDDIPLSNEVKNAVKNALIIPSILSQVQGAQSGQAGPEWATNFLNQAFGGGQFQQQLPAGRDAPNAAMEQQSSAQDSATATLQQLAQSGQYDASQIDALAQMIGSGDLTDMGAILSQAAGGGVDTGLISAFGEQFAGHQTAAQKVNPQVSGNTGQTPNQQAGQQTNSFADQLMGFFSSLGNVSNTGTQGLSDQLNKDGVVPSVLDQLKNFFAPATGDSGNVAATPNVTFNSDPRTSQFNPNNVAGAGVNRSNQQFNTGIEGIDIQKLINDQQNRTLDLPGRERAIEVAGNVGQAGFKTSGATQAAQGDFDASRQTLQNVVQRAQGTPQGNVASLVDRQAALDKQNAVFDDVLKRTFDAVQGYQADGGWGKSSSLSAKRTAEAAGEAGRAFAADQAKLGMMSDTDLMNIALQQQSVNNQARATDLSTLLGASQGQAGIGEAVAGIQQGESNALNQLLAGQRDQDIAQRGQTLSALLEGRGQDVSQRGQDTQALLQKFMQGGNLGEIASLLNAVSGANLGAGELGLKQNIANQQESTDAFRATTERQGTQGQIWNQGQQNIIDSFRAGTERGEVEGNIATRNREIDTILENNRGERALEGNRQVLDAMLGAGGLEIDAAQTAVQREDNINRHLQAVAGNDTAQRELALEALKTGGTLENQRREIENNLLLGSEANENDARQIANDYIEIIGNQNLRGQEIGVQREQIQVQMAELAQRAIEADMNMDAVFADLELRATQGDQTALLGLIELMTNQELQRYMANKAEKGAVTGGLFSLAGSAISKLPLSSPPPISSGEGG